MFIETTININYKIMQLLQTSADLLGVSKSVLASHILNEFILHNNKPAKLFCRVKYQSPDCDDNWKKLHVSLRCDLYEKALDVRKLSKRSVSLIFSIAVSKYLQKVIKKLMNSDETDNYLSLYIFSASISSKIDSYRVFYNIEEAENYYNQRE